MHQATVAVTEPDVEPVASLRNAWKAVESFSWGVVAVPLPLPAAVVPAVVVVEL